MIPDSHNGEQNEIVDVLDQWVFLKCCWSGSNGNWNRKKTIVLEELLEYIINERKLKISD